MHRLGDLDERSVSVWCDSDRFSHVNNVVYESVYSQARSTLAARSWTRRSLSQQRASAGRTSPSFAFTFPHLTRLRTWTVERFESAGSALARTVAGEDVGVDPNGDEEGPQLLRGSFHGN